MKKGLMAIIFTGLIYTCVGQNKTVFYALNNNSPSICTPVDSNAFAFCNAVIAGGYVLSNSECTAIDELCMELKSANIWDKCVAIYPFVGNTGVSQQWNLKDPRNLDTAYRISWINTPTFSSNGVSFNQLNQYGNTHFIPSVALSGKSDAHIALYSNLATSSNFGYDVGTLDGSSSWAISLQYNNAHTPHFELSGIADIDLVSSDTKAFYLVSSDAANISTGDYYISAWRNGLPGSPMEYKNSSHTSNSFPNFPVFIGSNDNYGQADLFNLRGCKWLSMGMGEFTNSDALAYWTIVNDFETALGR